MKTAYLLTTCFGIGRVPFAPGTFGSLPAIAIYIALQYAAPATTPWALAILAAVFSWICIQYGPAIIADSGRKDPGFVVADEVAGQSLALIGAALVNPEGTWINAALAFVLFRLFDIAKPFPCKRLERLPGGVGILADDLMAGVYAAIAAIVFILLKAHFGPAATSMETEAALNPLSALLLGAVQGLTEFLPVSSSGHLVLLENLLPVPAANSKPMLLFDLILHVATIGSIAIVFGRRFWDLIKALFSIQKYQTLSPVRLYELSPAVRFCTLAVITTVVTAICYKLFKEPLESSRQLPVLAVTWAITAAVLFLTDRRKKTRRGLRDIGIAFAITVGIAQSIAILPGISRSGATICTAILLGLHRQWAIEYSFLISIPAILGGAVLQTLDTPEILSGHVLPWACILAGMAAAATVGVLSLKWLIRASRKQKLSSFALYCLLLSIFVLFYLL
ncbi:MAG: phosphatidylglycerophosphatase A [Planctomycetaceae bacterium]|nr:phosphatidylglycerophosphatase A [Planctomycetaceae bacterium]